MKGWRFPFVCACLSLPSLYAQSPSTLRTQPDSAFRNSLLPDSLFYQGHWNEASFATGQWEERLIEYMEEVMDEESAEVELDDGQVEIYQLSRSLHAQNINALDEDYLKQVVRLSDYQYYQLCRYVALFGEIMSYAELAAVDGFSVDWVRKNVSLVSVGKLATQSTDHFSWKKLGRGKVMLLTRTAQILESQAAYKGETPAYEGNPLHLLWKLSYQCENFLKIGWTAEKDPGESFFSKSNPHGFDYNAFYFSYQGKRRLRQCLLGDYRLQYGQGLAMGMGFQMQTSAPNTVEKSFVMKPHTSANETQFLRGIALRLALFPKQEMSLFFSSQKIDASISKDDTCSIVERLVVTGYHRNQHENAMKNSLNQRLCGVYHSFRSTAFRFGWGCSYLLFSMPLQQQLKLYNQFKFNRQHLWNGSMDYHWNLRRSVLFGEFAVSGNGTWACCNGLVMDPDDRLSISLLYQYKNPDYQGIPDVLQADMKLMNEHSIQWNAQCLIGTYACLHLSWKETRYPWLKYGVDAPSGSSRFRLCYEGRLSGSVQCRLVYGWKKGMENGTDGSIRRLFYTEKHSFGLRWHGSLSEVWTWKSSIDYQCTGFSNGSPYGVAFTQTAGYRNHTWQFTAGFSLFEVTSYKVALYVSEPDLLYTLSSAYLSGKGLRLLAVCSFKPSHHLSLYVRYAIFRYADRQWVGSGVSMIDGNHKSELKWQMIWKF